jgi:hypothetical protein
MYSLGPKSPSRPTLLIPLLRPDGPKRLPPAHQIVPSFLFFSLWALACGPPGGSSPSRCRGSQQAPLLAAGWARAAPPVLHDLCRALDQFGQARLAQAIKIGPRDLSSTPHPLGLADYRRKLKTEKGKEQVGCCHRRYGHPCLRRRSSLGYWLGGSLASMSRPC